MTTEIKRYIASTLWRPCYDPEPHEYTIVHERSGYYQSMLNLIANDGKEVIFRKRTYRVIDFDNYRYWLLPSDYTPNSYVLNRKRITTK